jgi:hypothetical protein
VPFNTLESRSCQFSREGSPFWSGVGLRVIDSVSGDFSKIFNPRRCNQGGSYTKILTVYMYTPKVAPIFAQEGGSNITRSCLSVFHQNPSMLDPVLARKSSTDDLTNALQDSSKPYLHLT